MVRSFLHMPQKFEPHFQKLASDESRSDIEVDGFGKLTADQLEAVRRGVFTEVSALVPQGRVLDFGCGTGRHLQHFSAPLYQRAGIDRNEGSLVRARKNLPDGEFSNVDLLQDDEFIERSSAHYDLLFSVSVLEYFQYWELRPLFKRFAVLLKRGGILNLLFPTPRNFLDKWSNDKYRKYYVADVRKPLEEIGLEIVRADLLAGVAYTGRVIARKKS